MGRVTAVRKRARLRLGRIVAVLAAALVAKVAWDLVTLPSAEPLASGPPPVTALMRQRDAEAAGAGLKPRRKQHVVGLQEIAPTAVSSVIISEDASFFVHEGIDTAEIEAAVARAMETDKLRGASTITQQLAKNLWLSTERSLTRKLKELVLTRKLESSLPKKRILWLYLNVVEWGDGVYGIDAGAKEHFHTDAAHLTIAQGAMLASMLPAPRTWIPAKHPAALYRRTMTNIANLEVVGKISAAQAAAARAELDAYFGRHRPPPPPAGEGAETDEPPPEEPPPPASATPPSPPEPVAGPPAPEPEPVGEAPPAQESGAEPR